MTQDQEKKLDKIMYDFAQWLGDHSDPLAEPKQAEEPPRALDILLDAEARYFAALENLDKKHRELETVDQINKLTKDIEKLCK